MARILVKNEEIQEKTPKKLVLPSLPKLSVKLPPRRILRLAGEAFLVLLALVLLVVVANLKADKNNLSRQLAAVQADPQSLVQKQTDAIIAEVGNLMTLPTGETPTVAAVSDAAAAKQQSPFFNNAQNGDKVLMYVKAGEAILYRPSTNKIILVAPLTFNNQAASASKQ